ncbi:hypothetical protein Pla123a_36740 [Posidoniimonas polymericola]|uniref:Peptidase family M50 n=1 Tax=Posidoniimonas polymericola TaxID=2528002 RepID=A0A5C5YEL4_9BACT|nr:hypothetical protein [Posidoniimonas polymericola]TWT73780.1 hypothetical protein Pla123a_36740 [Posidoniimonas polymericola]
MFGEHTERWSLSLGTYRGVTIRLHLSLLVVAAVILSYTAVSAPAAGGILLGVIVLSAVLHEAAHRFAAHRLHGGLEPITLTPIGGLRLPRVASDPEAQLLVAMVGPLVNLMVVVVAAGALAYTTSSLADVFSIVLPLGLLEDPPAILALKAAVWVNWLTFVLSLIPCFPFDAGPALRALFWPMLGRTSAELFTAQLARVIGWSTIAAGALLLQAAPQYPPSVSALLASLGLLVACSAQHELTLAARSPGAPFAGYLEDLPDPVSAARTPARLPNEALELTVEETWKPQALLTNGDAAPELDGPDEDEAVDAILARLHVHGPEHLSDADRKLLQRASLRYRERHS